MLRDAALLTLQLVKVGLHSGMILKDATPYNIQWHKGKFIFIDTLSFEKYEEAPWIAYRQFCENFLGPLLLMHYSKRQLPELMGAMAQWYSPGDHRITFAKAKPVLIIYLPAYSSSCKICFERTG
ncbi:MAG: hypothetical protein WDO16_09435 [Bacteroidota bacterium]